MALRPDGIRGPAQNHAANALENKTFGVTTPQGVRLNMVRNLMSGVFLHKH
jgi:hypothetical protein